MEKLLLTDYLQKCKNFEGDPSEEKEKEIKEFISQIQIKEYMPLKDKVINAVEASTVMNNNLNIGGAAAYVFMLKIRFGLLRYCTNLIDDTGVISMTYGVYDDIMQFGLYKAILRYVEDDYKIFCNLFDNLLDIKNIRYIMQSTEMFSVTNFEEWKQTLKDFDEKLTPEILEDLKASNVESAKILQPLEADIQKFILSGEKEQGQQDQALSDFLQAVLKKEEEEK